MPNHETRTFHGIVWAVNTISFLAILCHIAKKKFVNKFFKIYVLETSSRSYCVHEELSASCIRKRNV